jgi:hypothetical protein
MKRITVEEVVEAFKVTGLKPKPGSYFDKERNEDKFIECACGLGALFKAGNPEEGEDSLDVTHHFDNLLGSSYRLGFVHGFDGIPPQGTLSVEYMAGYDIGNASREALNVTEVAK